MAAEIAHVVSEGGAGHLKARGLTVRYGGLVALNDVTIEVASGSITGLIGPNGSGKTTFVNTVTGLQEADAGQITLDGVALGTLPAHARVGAGVARTFQLLRLFPSLSVLDNVLLGAHHLRHTTYLDAIVRSPRFRRERTELRERAMALLAEFGERLVPRRHDPVAALSYANKRRTEMCRAFMSSPRLLILDEPTAGMNPVETAEFAGQLARLRARHGCSVLLVEHKMEFIAALCSTVYVLDHGTLIAVGDPCSVQAEPAVMEAFLGAE